MGIWTLLEETFRLCRAGSHVFWLVVFASFPVNTIAGRNVWLCPMIRHGKINRSSALAV